MFSSINKLFHSILHFIYPSYVRFISIRYSFGFDTILHFFFILLETKLYNSYNYISYLI